MESGFPRLPARAARRIGRSRYGSRGRRVGSVKGQRGVRRLAAVVLVLTCMAPSAADGQSATDVTTTTRRTPAFGDIDQAVSAARSDFHDATTTTTPTTTTPGDAGQSTGIGGGKAVFQGGTTTTTTSLMASPSTTDDPVLVTSASDALDRVDRVSPSPGQQGQAPRAAVGDAALAGPTTPPLESATENATTTVAPPSLVVAGSDQLALADEVGGPVQRPVVGLDLRALGPWMLLVGLALLLAPSVVRLGRGERR
jgi:hypothetical protein